MSSINFLLSSLLHSTLVNPDTKTGFFNKFGDLYPFIIPFHVLSLLNPGEF